MKILALMLAILLLKAAKRIAWLAELAGDCGVWIVDQCDPKTPRRT
ncbi:hypothetical protein [Shinella sp.]|nr:hypothetical protein [Shinella sp.]